MVRVALVAALLLLGGDVVLAQGAVERVQLVARPGDDAQPFAFVPAATAVAVGMTVRWTNRSDAEHTVTFAEAPGRREPNGVFDQALSAPGDSVEFTFARAGTYFYFCQRHPAFMSGRVDVDDPRYGATAAVGALAVAAILVVIGLAVRARRRVRSR